MADKKISELSTASEIKNGDNIELSQDTGNGLVSLKATILALATKILTNINFTSALTTTSKTVIGAINEVAEGGGGMDVIAEDFDNTATYAVGDYCIYNGSLYKCTTAVTTAGDWDSSDWTETLVMDEVEQGGGGGGAGHTIKDDGGNALTQRSNLQFKGVYSHDDSINSASVVEVARQMTRAQYNLLSEDEKKGLIQIIDEFDADIMFVNGVFIDTNNILQAFTAFTTEATYTATEDCVVIGGMSTTSNKTAYVRINGVNVFEHYSGSGEQSISNSFFLKKGQTILFHNETNWANINGYTVYGIQAGTNPSIPDYSTTDHKTGRKWIDGKDIYEITLAIPSLSAGSNTINHGISNFGKMIHCEGTINYDGDDLILPYMATSISSSNVEYGIEISNFNSTRYFVNLGSAFNVSKFTSGYVTVQYTKAS